MNSGIGFYFFNLDVIRKSLGYLLSGLIVTVEVAVLVVAIGSIIGLVLALLTTVKVKHVGTILRSLIRIYVDLLRASPYLVLLSLMYFGLPFIGINLSTFWTTVITFSACLSAFIEENIRAGIEAVNKGQIEASRSLGMSASKTLFYVVMPQALRIAIPTFTNWAVAITKALSMASAIALPELLKQARHAQGIYANPSPLVAAAVIYIILFLPFVKAIKILENKWKHEC